MGYGVGSNVLLYPHLGFGIDSIKNTFYMPYFQIYGELFLDTIVSDGKAYHLQPISFATNLVVLVKYSPAIFPGFAASRSPTSKHLMCKQNP